MRGTIYAETCNKGRGRKTRCLRFVAEIVIDGRRLRRRSTNCDKVKAWLEEMNGIKQSEYKEERERL